MLPHKVLHAMCQAHFGRQGLRPLKVVQLLPGGRLELKRILGLGRVQEVEGVTAVVVGVLEVLDWVFDPAFLDEGVAHVFVTLAEDSEDLLRGVSV